MSSGYVSRRSTVSRTPHLPHRASPSGSADQFAAARLPLLPRKSWAATLSSSANSILLWFPLQKVPIPLDDQIGAPVPKPVPSHAILRLQGRDLCSRLWTHLFPLLKKKKSCYLSQVELELTIIVLPWPLECRGYRYTPTTPQPGPYL